MSTRPRLQDWHDEFDILPFKELNERAIFKNQLFYRVLTQDAGLDPALRQVHVRRCRDEEGVKSAQQDAMLDDSLIPSLQASKLMNKYKLLINF